ncbi:helix-turn-helix domain-containing protein [Roseinatronobacter thiooxidans]|uniref:helix-turn-helix domain-containing protein n=1 Tax=Roseinatronobacter thiooxidans TaxID=121821 RepID=UPI000DAC83AB
MQVHRAHVYRLYPTPEQLTLLARTAGVVRFVYNLALEQRRTWGGRPYRADGPGASAQRGCPGSCRRCAGRWTGSGR